MLLLSVVTLISAGFLAVISLFEPASSIAPKSSIAANQVPVRVIVPFVPNTNPSER
ncbi:hypothetical protein [Bradyrhizobium sp. SYSU BS000235]|uniref:hypothetical protein n=1 Tax=Bradyrhizobium sp. SYSU BS000235 TaxID=3411332 RepID=UPI003C777DC6